MNFEESLLNETREDIKKYAKEKEAAYIEAARQNKYKIFGSELKKRIKVFKKSPLNQNPEEPTDAEEKAYLHLFNGEAKPIEQKHIGRTIQNKMAIDPKKQTSDEHFLKQKIIETGIDAYTKKNKKDNGTHTVDFTAKKYLDQDGKIVDKKGDREKGIKSSDAIINVDGKQVFCTFKSTFSNGGGQDHQKNEAFAVVSKARKRGVYTIAVLDGNYYYKPNGEQTEVLKEAIKEIGVKRFTLAGVSFCSVMPAGVFVKKLSVLAETIKQQASIVTEELITEEDVNEARSFLSSLDSVENAMKQQNMNVSVLQKIKAGFTIFINKIKNIGTAIKNRFIKKNV